MANDELFPAVERSRRREQASEQSGQNQDECAEITNARCVLNKYCYCFGGEAVECEEDTPTTSAPPPPPTSESISWKREHSTIPEAPGACCSVCSMCVAYVCVCVCVCHTSSVSGGQKMWVCVCVCVCVCALIHRLRQLSKSKDNHGNLCHCRHLGSNVT